ncbi:cyclic peptide export ABC transporter [Lysobacter enzymogenes]|uniref:cyclic peptide export ABC transporter n=1 Tax=Lysobacter enzymogenes TaxID=69 RepID=UPI00099DD3B0|nr:cyclic peptide export ABC transporter [Lysobacter enzymogenes]UZW58375.1 cyclic peptide export ABC transporter [Lysobacter enzymogenes]
MKVVRLAARNAMHLLVPSVGAGLVAGLGGAALIALINRTLNDPEPATPALVAAYAAMCALVPLSRLASAALLIKLSQRMTYDLRMRLSERILGAPLRHLEEIGTHRLLAALTDDVLVIANAVVNIPVVCVNLAVLLGCMAYVGYLSLPLLASMLLAIAVGVVSYLLPMARANRRLRLARELQNDLFKHFNGLTGGIKELKLHQRRAKTFTGEVLEASAEAVRRHTAAGMTAYAAASSFGQGLLFGFIGLLIFKLGGMLDASVEVMAGCVLVALYMMGPLEVIVNALPAFGRARISLQNFEQLGLSLAAQPRERMRSAPTAHWRSLELDRVAFRYRAEDDKRGFAVGPISLQLKPGEIVFVTGGNGTGKTTFVKLLTGLYAPDSGQIRLDDEIVDDAARVAYRQNFSAVFFDFHLFDQLLGLDVGDAAERIRAYLEVLQLGDKVSVREGALSTTELSQGQRKRLALLTAYLEDRPIYVFDEWAADQDPVFKEVFYRKLLPELKHRGKTVVVISHDDRYFEVADRIVKLDAGKFSAPASAARPFDEPIRPEVVDVHFSS